MKVFVKITLLAIFLALAGFSCDTDSDLLSPEKYSGMIINSGTSFGMCMGYCVRSLDLSGTNAEYHMISYQPDDYPYKSIDGEISIYEWNQITTLVNDAVIRNMKDVYGCPDCADGGAEWIEITTETYNKKITFEVGNVPNQIYELAQKLRSIRDRFNPDKEN